MKITFVCHIEYDLKNSFGEAKKIASSEQSFYHLPILFDFIRGLKIPVTLSFMVGGFVDSGLLKFLRINKNKIPEFCEKGIHYHQKEFTDGRLEDLTQEDLFYYFKLFEESFKEKPKSVVFGKWRLKENQLPFLAEFGIKCDGSWVPNFHNEEYIIRPPFYLGDILEIPPVADGRKAINPFTRLSHYFLLRRIIKKNFRRNFVLHIAFHSYDLFNFKGTRPRIRFIKEFIFKDILKLIKKYNLKILNLSDIQEGEGEGLKAFPRPFLSKIFNTINH